MSTETDLDDVFGFLASEVRIDILRALWREHTADPEAIEGPEPEPVPFSTLRERVGVRDSGRFNYHLDELVPEFIEQRADGYVLTFAGARIVGAAVSGVYTGTDTELEAFRVGECTRQECSGTFEATYEKGHVTVTCSACPVGMTMHAPPILVEAHDMDTDPRVLQEFTLTELQRIVRGFCQVCTGPLDVRVAATQPDTDGENGDSVRVTHICEECGSISKTNAATFLFDHPALVSLLHEAGIDYRAVPLWQAPESVDIVETIESEEPLRIVVRITVASQTLRFVLGDGFEVDEYRRVAD